MKKDFSFGIVPVFFEKEIPLFLLVRHRAGHWAFPKGHKEGEETSFETALRELKEETGLSVEGVYKTEPIKEVYSFRQGTETIEKTVEYFVAKVKSNGFVIDHNEIIEAGWFLFQNALTKLTFPEGRQTLKTAVHVFS